MPIFGFTIARIRGRSMEPELRHGTIALFRKRKRPVRGEVVLVDHPKLGRIARKVTTVGRKGNVHLAATSRRVSGRCEKAGAVPREAVCGVLVRKLGRISLFGPRRRMDVY